MYSPTREERKADRDLKYLHGINVGRVVRITSSTSVELAWWFSDKVDSVWYEWRDRLSKRRYLQNMEVRDLVSSGEKISKLLMSKPKGSKCTMSVDSQFLLSDVALQ